MQPHRLSPLLALAAVGLAAACGAPSPTGSSALAGPGQPSISPTGPASPTTTRLTLPFSAPRFIPCVNGGAGEVVDITTTLNVVIHETVSASGEVVSTLQLNPQGATGVGETTGLTYHSGGVEGGSETFQADGLPFEITIPNHTVVTAPGEGNTFIITQFTHITIDANGDATAQVVKLTAECH